MIDNTVRKDPCANALDQYKTCIQDLGNIGGRHENSRKFYLSVVSALFVFIALAGKEGLLESVRGYVLILSGIVGILLCIVWVLHMQSFRAIYRAKLDVLRAIEDKCDLYHVFGEE